MDKKFKKKMLKTYFENTVVTIARTIAENVFQDTLTATEGDNLLTTENMKSALYKHYEESKVLGRFWVTDRTLLRAEEVKTFKPKEIEAMIDEAVKVDFKKEVDQLREIFGYDNMGD
ncbi:hypothetical protein [Mammaliicoccus sciuri]|uniref:hypothetical protein n=1 Tax=Mammaliicoccus sciuri TaxID=1296 RepID=UPI001FB4B82F|nr:hypothetical protein [Mammaliicoccus sciuri]MCJ0941545.1 hypothetical protein [Mammaliicoccus sciuri]